jgi:hypothetical protein
VGDETDFPRDIAEMALAHAVGNEVEQAYRRATALEIRGDWFDHHCRPILAFGFGPISASN